MIFDKHYPLFVLMMLLKQRGKRSNGNHIFFSPHLYDFVVIVFGMIHVPTGDRAYLRYRSALTTVCAATLI